MCVLVYIVVLYLLNRLINQTDVETDWSGAFFGFPENSSRIWRRGLTSGGQSFVIGKVLYFLKYRVTEIYVKLCKTFGKR